MLEKRVVTRNGHKYYLLGTHNVNGKVKHVYLEKENWDCDWYWGFGYLVSFTNDNNPEQAKDIDGWEHFDSTFLGHGCYVMNAFKEYFIDMVLTEKEQYQLWEIMKTLYTFRKTADTLHIGGSHVTTNPCRDLIKNKDLCEKFNGELMPALFEEVRKLLTPAE